MLFITSLNIWKGNILSAYNNVLLNINLLVLETLLIQKRYWKDYNTMLFTVCKCLLLQFSETHLNHHDGVNIVYIHIWLNICLNIYDCIRQLKHVNIRTHRKEKSNVNWCILPLNSHYIYFLLCNNLTYAYMYIIS